MRCWGLGSSGQLGYGSTGSVGDNETPASQGDIVLGGVATGIVTGEVHSCALLQNGAVRCWGSGSKGQLGYGVASLRQVGDDELPQDAGDVPVGGEVTALAAGWTSTCAVLGDGAVRCWGNGVNGGLGYGNSATIGDDEPASALGNVDLGGPANQVSAGWNHACARMQGGSVRCWGFAGYGALGYGNTSNIGDNESPAAAGDVPLAGRALSLSLGAHHSCALLEQGLSCWGAGGSGRLGYGNPATIGDDEPASAAGYIRVQ